MKIKCNKFCWIIIILFVAYIVIGGYWMYQKGYHAGYRDGQNAIVNDKMEELWK